MIEAQHSKIARLIFNIYINRLLRKSFTDFQLVNSIPEIPNDKSLIVTPNHISWWDGFFIDYVTRRFINKKLHLMMLESSLRKYWFFGKLGCYSINPQNSSSIKETILYTRKVLKDESNFVVTYPQGEIEPFEKRPLSIKEGLKLFLKENLQTLVLPVGFKIQYYDEKNPSVICRFGEILSAEQVVNDFNYYKNVFTDNLDRLNEASNTKKFEENIF